MTKIPENFYNAELVDRTDLTSDLALFRFRREAGYDFQAGQFATIAVEEDGKRIQRAYSIVSSPEEPMLEFFIELVPDGKLTPKLWLLKQGEAALIRKRAAGHFILDEKSGMKNHLMAATVTGIAPFASMIRTHHIRLKRADPRSLRFALVYAASRSEELGPYREEMEEIAREGWLNVIPTVSRPWEDPSWQGETGRVEDVIRKHADALGFDHTNTVAYACGNPQMIENVKGILRRARFPKERFHEEKYFQL